MSHLQHFAEYAAAFEKTVETNELSHIEPFFTEDAVYETSGGEPMNNVSEGREAVFAQLEGSLDLLDRRFEARGLELLEGPTETENTVWFAWRATYTTPGLPELVIEGEETVIDEGDRIRRLEDRFAPEAAKLAIEYLTGHAPHLAANA